MLNIECNHAICLPRIHALCFLTKFYGNSTFMVIVWILVKNSGVHLDCLWQKHEQRTWCQKVSNVYWTNARYIFSNVFLCPQGEHTSSAFVRRKKSPVLCTNILWEHISCFFFAAELCAIVMIHNTMIVKNIWCLLRKQEICSHKMFACKTGHNFSQKHWRCSPWGYRKNIGENISCIHSVDIANFLAPVFYFYFFVTRWTPLFLTKIHTITIKVEFP